MLYWPNKAKDLESKAKQCIVCFQAKQTAASTATGAVVEDIIETDGVPKEIRTDNATALKSEELRFRLLNFG